MPDHRTFVIVGASLAGGKAAEALRTEGFDGRVVLVGEEADRPYERPPLSKGHLRGEVDATELYLHAETFYDDHAIELLTATRATSLDAAARVVHLGDGDTIPYDSLLLATGATPRRLQVPGADLDGIHYLRTRDHCVRLRDALAPASRVAVVGGGWIGSEVAASARQMGKEVVVIHRGHALLERVLGAEVAGFYRAVHEDNGVTFVSAGVAGFVGQGRTEAVVTDDGRTVPAEVVGVGAAPRSELAAGSGLAVRDGGVVVDERLRTSAAAVFAAGDVASAWHPLYGRHVRVEHWANAFAQGPTAARNMLGIDTVYDRVPHFFSDQYDLGMGYSGLPSRWDRVVFRGEPASREFVVFWLNGIGWWPA